MHRGADLFELTLDVHRVGLGQDRPDVAATICWWFLGTFTSTLRMKWTRPRFQLAPGNIFDIAAFRPRCESLMTSWTPKRPRPQSD